MLIVPGKMYERALTEKLMEITEGKVSKDQGRFRNGKGCVDQMFVMKMWLRRNPQGRIKKKMYAAFMDFKRKYMIGLIGKLSGMF